MYPLKAISFAAVPDLIQQGEIIEYSENWQQRGYRTYVIAAPIRVQAGEFAGDYWMGVIVKSDANMQNLYAHDVTVIKKKVSMPFKAVHQSERLAYPQA